MKPGSTIGRHIGIASMCAVVAAAATSCGGGSSGDATVGPPPFDPDPVLAEANIGPTGGTLIAPTLGSSEIAVELEISAGALTQGTNFRVLLDVDNDAVPSVFPVYRVEANAGNTLPSSVSLSVRAGDLLFAGVTPNLTLFQRTDASAAWVPVPTSQFDPASRSADAQINSLGEFVVLDGNLHRLFTQTFEIIDPEEPRSVASIAGVSVFAEQGQQPEAFVGSGSLASFWNSTADDNVLILPGVFSSPLDFMGAEDLIANLSLTRSNVVLLSYPTGRGVQESANRLFDLIAANRQPGFGCTIIGHSMGGLIARYMLERSAGDPERAGFATDSQDLTGMVEQLVLLGVPNGGAQSITQAFSFFTSALDDDERFFVQAALDLDEQPGSLPLEMNASYVDNQTVYHTVYGDVGVGSDGVVPVVSALALPLTEPETTMMFASTHDDLHLRATSLGIAQWIGSLLQGLQ
ncbi:MAG: hypothetical protein AB8H80_08870 [Planctomycetota bacterium]